MWHILLHVCPYLLYYSSAMRSSGRHVWGTGSTPGSDRQEFWPNSIFYHEIVQWHTNAPTL